MSTVAEDRQGQWISINEGARRVGLPHGRVRKLVLDGVIGSVRLSGLKVMINWPDLERVFAAGVRKGKG